MTPISAPTPRELAVQCERADTLNWLDDFDAAPPHVAAALGLATRQQGDLAMVRSRIPFSHFNMVLTLGCPAAADDAAFGAVDAFYAEGGCGRHWIVVNEYSQPADLAARLLARGYQPAGAWERIVSREARPDLWEPHAAGCELVNAGNADEWIAFLLKSYGMPAIIGDWLGALVGRKRWIHAMRREGGRADGAVAMVRSIYLADDGWAWLGIDAPVPGVMAPCYEDDQKVTAALLCAAAAAGARRFVSDIEVPAENHDGPAYERWGALGFAPVYLRALYSKG